MENYKLKKYITLFKSIYKNRKRTTKIDDIENLINIKDLFQ